MISRIDLDQTDDMSVVTIVATELFSDGITNWGRIASLLAFGAVLCKHLNDSGRSECVSLVGEEMSAYLLSKQMDWLLKNNAWVSFSFKNSVTNSLLVKCAFQCNPQTAFGRVFWSFRMLFCFLQDGFVDFFHVPDTEAAVRNALMAIGSVATFGAALAYWIRWFHLVFRGKPNGIEDTRELFLYIRSDSKLFYYNAETIFLWKNKVVNKQILFLDQPIPYTFS